MKFVMLIYHPHGELPPEEMQRLDKACRAWHQELVRSGKSEAAMKLDSVSNASTLRASKGKVVITDGPFAETKEVLGGFEVLECEDLEAALAVAKRFPGISFGASVEIRPALPPDGCAGRS